MALGGSVRFGSKHHIAFDRLGVSGVEGPTEDPVGVGAEGDWEVEEPVEDPAPPGRQEVQLGGTRLSLRYGCGSA